MTRVIPHRVLRSASLAVVLGTALSALAFADTSEAATTALTASAIGPARYVRANDGRVHVDYDLLLTNSFVGDVTLKRLTVRAGGRVLQRLGPKRFAAHTHPILKESQPVSTISPSATVMVLVDVPLPNRGRIPRRLSHRISYKLPKDFPPNAVIDSTTVRGPRLTVAQRKPLVISSPLRGSGWWAGGGCCDPDQRHRGLLLANNGSLVPTEMFDIDWLQIANGRLFSGDGKKLTDYPGFGAKIHSVSRGRVVKVVNDRPEAPLTGPNDELDGANNFAGNRVVVRMARHRFAFYAHFQPHSIRVHRGEQVRPGQVLGLLGNSGNSAAPHLHFGIHNGPSPATSASLPWVFDRYRYQGSGDVTDTGEVPLNGTPSHQRDTYPLNLSSLVLR
jgi:peptidase M23-like protein